jgi:hypothetical protein
MSKSQPITTGYASFAEYIKYSPEYSLSKAGLPILRVGDKVIPFMPDDYGTGGGTYYCGFNRAMGVFIGRVCTVSEVTYYDHDSRHDVTYRLQEDPNGWHFNEHWITLQESV